MGEREAQAKSGRGSGLYQQDVAAVRPQHVANDHDAHAGAAPSRRVVKNGSNTRAAFPGEIPMPLSLTATRQAPSAVVAFKVTWPPRGHECCQVS